MPPCLRVSQVYETLAAYRQRLEARRQEEQAAMASVQELTKKEREVEGQLEEASKQLKELKEEADTLRDRETAEAQHVQVHIMFGFTAVSSKIWDWNTLSQECNAKSEQLMRSLSKPALARKGCSKGHRGTWHRHTVCESICNPDQGVITELYASQGKQKCLGYLFHAEIGSSLQKLSPSVQVISLLGLSWQHLSPASCM